MLASACRKPSPPPPEPSAATPVTSTLPVAATPPASSATQVTEPQVRDAEPSLALGSLLAEPDAAPRASARVVTPPRAGERTAVAEGRYFVGSTPGDEGRDPKLEPVQYEVALSAFEIDRLPYPNDPAEPPRTDVTATDAARLCSARGERLCSEIEWEAACRGPLAELYATGEAWDAQCGGAPTRCASSTGALGLGALREWTGSEVSASGAVVPKSAVRGSGSNDPGEHRCAHRAMVAGTAHARDLGFRCCRGAPNAAPMPTPKLGPNVRKATLEPGQLAEIFAGIPKLASLRAPLRYFVEPEDPTAVLRRGKTANGAADPEGFTLTTSPLIWNPAPGDELLVVAGHGARDSFIVALYRLPDNRYQLASSLLLVNDLGPFVLAYHPEVRERLLWSSCWKCSGEGGAVSLRDGRRVVIVQQ